VESGLKALADVPTLTLASSWQWIHWPTGTFGHQRPVAGREICSDERLVFPAQESLTNVSPVSGRRPLRTLTSDAIFSPTSALGTSPELALSAHLQTVEREAKLRRKPTVAVPSNQVARPTSSRALVAELLTGRAGIIFGTQRTSSNTLG
jgi:hypothetical protein